MKKLFLISSLIIALLLSSSAFAATPPINIKHPTKHPGFKNFYIADTENEEYSFSYNITPGSHIHDGIVIQNQDKNRHVLLRLEVTPAAKDINNNPQVSIPPEWISLSHNEIKLQPEQATLIEFDVNIPKDIELQNYKSNIKAIVTNIDTTAEGLDDKSSNSGLGVSVDIGTQIELNVQKGPAMEVERVNIPNSVRKEATEKNSDNEQPQIKKLSNSIYNFIDERFDIILIFAVFLLLLKIVLKKKKK